MKVFKVSMQLAPSAEFPVEDKAGQADKAEVRVVMPMRLNLLMILQCLSISMYMTLYAC